MVLTQFGDVHGHGTMLVAPGTDIFFLLHLIIIVKEGTVEISSKGSRAKFVEKL